MNRPDLNRLPRGRKNLFVNVKNNCGNNKKFYFVYFALPLVKK